LGWGADEEISKNWGKSVTTGRAEYKLGEGLADDNQYMKWKWDIINMRYKKKKEGVS